MTTIRPIRRKYRPAIVLLRAVILLGVCLSFIIIVIYSFHKTVKIYNRDLTLMIPEQSSKYVFFKKKQVLESLSISDIKKRISKFNTEEKILNIDTFGAVKEDSTIFVIYITTFSNNLKYLIVSLSQVEGIEDALIIFSHSYFDENINSLIMMIDFCRVMQIFYPHSVQVYPNQFPGYQPRDCSHNMNIKTAEAIHCVGVFSPDIHGRYRNPSHSEQKHHWWWTANKVFENLTCTENHNGIVIFAESDIYFAQDFLYMALYMKNIAKSQNQCDFLSLGTILSDGPNSNMMDRVDVQTWDPELHSKVLAFDLSVWNSLIIHYDLFCAIDDYSWARSLYYVSLNRRDGKRFKVITSGWPRAFTLSSCTNDDCEATNLHDIIQSLDEKTMNNYIINMYPPHLELYINVELEDDEYIIFDYVESNGGWNDPRDKALCSNMTVNKLRKVLMDMKNEFGDYRSLI